MQLSHARSERNDVARELFEGLSRRYDVLAEVLSFGQNRRWRRAIVDRVVTGRPGLVLDVATGPAGVALEIAERTAARVVGVDLSEEMLRQGMRNVAREGRRDLHLLLARGEELPFPSATFDALTFTYLLRYVDDPAATMAELARVVKPGGTVASLEFAVPEAPIWRAAWWLYTRGVLPIAGAVTGGRDWYRVGRFLGPSVSEHARRCPPDWLIQAWERAGLADVGMRRMSLGGGLVMWGRRHG